jgi:alkyl sulfatase BDS1-like metallo-beta-lactamase superfamily hydrolase
LSAADHPDPIGAGRIEPSIHPELAEHTHLYTPPRVHHLGRVHCAVGWNIANITMIEGDDGIVMVDTGMNQRQAVQVQAELAAITAKPLAAVILTHHHADHVQGTQTIVASRGAQAPDVPIYAHASLMDEYSQENVLIGPIMNARAIPMYNLALSGAEAEGMNVGIGPRFEMGHNHFARPTHTFDDELEITVAGIRMQLLHVPSEAESELCVWLPDDRVLLSAEVVQDHTCPNIYTLRGAKHRDAKQWYQSIDLMRQWSEAEHMVLQHGPPVSGGDEVAHVLQGYRDGIQYQHDQTLRLANQGYAADEIAQRLRLPPHLEEWSPWLRPFYGSVEHNVPAIFNDYLGWFDGDPVVLAPTPRPDYARRLVDLMGGRQAVLAAAAAAIDGDDPQFGAELATYLIRVDTEDRDARLIKARAFRILGFAQINPTWRGFYLTAAGYLDGSLGELLDTAHQLAGAVRYSPDSLGQLPAAVIVDQLPVRLVAEAVLELELAVGLAFTDGQADDQGEFTVELRRGVAEIRPGIDPQVAAVLRGGRQVLGPVLLAGGEPAARLATEGLEVDGSPEAAAVFLGAFEDPSTRYPSFFVR